MLIRINKWLKFIKATIANQTCSFVLRKKREGLKFGFAIIMVILYFAARVGKADHITSALEKLLGKEPISLDQFIDNHK